MQIVADRLREFQHFVALPQNKLASLLGLRQSGVNRYENNQCEPSIKVLLRYADFFDVSLDYICGRTDDLKGIAYSGEPQLERLHPELGECVST